MRQLKTLNPNMAVIVFLILFVTLSSATNANILESNNQIWIIKYQVGDSLKWKEKNYDDKNWASLFFSQDDLTIETDSIHLWLRAQVLLAPDFKKRKDFEVLCLITGTYDVFWNGVFIGRNYPAEKKSSEIYGSFLSQIKIPDSLIQTRSNLLTFRITKKSTDNLDIDLLNIDKHSFNSLIKYLMFVWILLMLLIFIMLTIYYSRKTLSDKSYSKYTFFFVLAFLFSMSTLFNLVIVTLNLNYLMYLIIDSFDLLLALFLSISLPIYFTNEFNFPYKKTIWFVVTTTILFSFYATNNVEFCLLSTFFISIAILIWASYKKQFSSYFALFGLLGILLLIFYGVFDSTILTGLPIFALFIIIDVSKEAAFRKIQVIDAQYKSSRLEIELYRKFIQPHYILNSLNTAIEWLEEEPSKGIDFITALSDEFHTLSKITDKKLITIEEELKICKAHLKIMSYRKSINYILETNNVNEFNTIPPALFHTIIENGITHNQNNNIEKIKFSLTEEKINNGRKYSIINSNFNFQNSKVLEIPKDNNLGIGYNYIKARLTESYGNNWNLSWKQNKNSWVTTIEIYE